MRLRRLWNRTFQAPAGAGADDPPALVADESLDARYLDFLRSKVVPGAKLSSLRMCWLREWRAYKLGPELFESLGAKVIAIGIEPDGRNINAVAGRCTSKDCKNV